MSPLGPSARRWLVVVVLAGTSLLLGLCWLFRHPHSKENQEVGGDTAALGSSSESARPPSPGSWREPPLRPAPKLAPQAPAPPSASSPPAQLEAKKQGPGDQSLRPLTSEEPRVKDAGLAERLRHIQEAVLKVLPFRKAR